MSFLEISTFSAFFQQQKTISKNGNFNIPVQTTKHNQQNNTKQNNTQQNTQQHNTV